MDAFPSSLCLFWRSSAAQGIGGSGGIRSVRASQACRILAGMPLDTSTAGLGKKPLLYFKIERLSLL